MHTGRCKLLALAVGGLTLFGPSASAADWPRFRGPNGTGISADKDIPVRWGPESVRWKTPIPGVGNSSPIVWGGKLFLQSSSPDAKERRLLCLDAASGKMLWSEAVPGSRAHTHQKNTMASSTPATDGERVYALFWDGRDVGVYAYDFQGKLLWKQDLGAFTSQHGPGTSPMVCGDKVVVANDQDGASRLVALDAKTGKVVWQVPRPPFRACYSTPFLLETPGGKPELIVASTAGVTSYEPDSGTESWGLTWSFAGPPLRTVGSPIYTQGLILATSGDGAGDRDAIAVKAHGKGDVSRTNLAWENRKKNLFPYVPCMLAWGDHVYYINDKGVAACLDPRTGTEVWSEELSRTRTGVTASPVLIDGKMYAINEAGTVYVLAAAPKFQLLAKNGIDEPVMASPAVADGRLFIRGKTHLYCIGKPPVK